MVGWLVVSSDGLLGLLSHTLGKLEDAASHFEDASAFCRRAGYRPELYWSCCYYAFKMSRLDSTRSIEGRMPSSLLTDPRPSGSSCSAGSSSWSGSDKLRRNRCCDLLTTHEFECRLQSNHAFVGCFRSHESTVGHLVPVPSRLMKVPGLGRIN